MLGLLGGFGGLEVSGLGEGVSGFRALGFVLGVSGLEFWVGSLIGIVVPPLNSLLRTVRIRGNKSKSLLYSRSSCWCVYLTVLPSVLACSVG